MKRSLAFPVRFFLGTLGVACVPTGSLAQSQLTDVGGYEIEYRIRGSGGPVVVFINGGTAPMEYWDPVTDRLSARATVITYERAGHGRSEMGREPRHALNVAEELRALLSNLGVTDSFFLVAHSAGCLYARVFVSRFPEGIKGVLLMEPGDKEFLDAFGVLHLSGIEGREWTDLWSRTWTRLAQGEGGFAKEVQEKDETIRQMLGLTFPQEIPLTIVSALDRSRPDWFLADFSPKVVEEFYRQKVVYHQTLARSSTEGLQVPVDDATHVVHEDRPDLVLELILEMVGISR